jgi:tRNA-specific 2-thiouridylase
LFSIAKQAIYTYTRSMITLKPLVEGKKPEDTTVVVAMSGGVDSSVVAGLLHKLGYKTIGITLQLWDYTPASSGAQKKFGTCCALDDVYDARRVCQTLGIPHYVLNYESEFKDKVIDDFVETYLAGATPIPCVRCNQRIKFDSFMEKAKALGADVLVTGHYVRKDIVNGKHVIKRGVDHTKDQSYYLFTTTPEQLEYADFPLGNLSKDQTRELAKELGLHVHSKKDSQDICFVPGGDYRKVVRKFAPEGEGKGNIVNMKGEVIATHNGIIDFTVGQRKGLGGGFKTPHYVVEIRPNTREVVIGEKEDLGTLSFTAKDINWLDDGPIEGREVLVKVRSLHKGVMATLHDLGDGRVEVDMHTKEPLVAPGQAAVFYDENDILLGGGWIETAPESRLKVRIA